MKTLKGMNGMSARTQSGFTLIEIAIVLVIIGLLLGGVLQGQQLIENSRVKNAVNTFNGISAAAFSYQDRYGRLPGDDGPTATLTARGASWSSSTGSGGTTERNGVIDSALASTFAAASVEGPLFYQHLRAAGFISGDPDSTGLTAYPTNAFGGLVGITTDPMGTQAAATDTPLTGTKICMGSVNGSAAIALDTQLDDGGANSGRFRATQGDANTAPGTVDIATNGGAYSEDNIYTVCYRI